MLSSRCIPLRSSSLFRSLIYHRHPRISLRKNYQTSNYGMPHSVHESSRETSPARDQDLSQLYWNYNVHPKLWTAECPSYLIATSEKNKRIMAANDNDFRNMTWPEVQHLVATNRIDQFQRPPSQLRRYLQFMHELKKKHGSVMAFVQQHRLQWESAIPSPSKPFTNPADYRILYNDWPYGIDPDIIHLVVWTKFLLEDDPATDDLTMKARQEIENFVVETFCYGEGGVERSQLIWFKNWRSLKSIHALEHFHVMLYRPTQTFLDRITQGDRPTSSMIF